jgi:DNA-binding SARP family transcriptional activator
MASLHVHLLGGFCAFDGGHAVTALDTPRLQSVLAYLLLHRHTPLSREHLAFRLWPDMAEDRARANLRKVLHRLREALPDSDRYLDVDARAVQWRTGAPFKLDVVEFENSAVAADPQRLRHAVSLYRGDLLPDHGDEWLVPERERLHRLMSRALMRLAELLEGERRYGEAAETADRLVRHDPVMEDGYRMLMRVHAAAGDRAAALRAYRRCVAVLRSELGIGPGPAIREAHQLLLAAGDGAVRGGAAPLLVVGREAEWAALQSAWSRAAAGHPGVLLLTGDAGIGKTHLAEAFLAWADAQGIPTASARCEGVGEALPYWPVAQWLRARPLPPLQGIWRREIARLLPEAGTGDRAAGSCGQTGETWQPPRLCEALARALLGAGPRALLLDDVAGCDTDTLGWLRYLLQFDPRARLLVIMTARPEAMESAPSVLPVHLAHWRRHGQFNEVTLGPLCAESTAVLASRAAGFPLSQEQLHRILAETEGNPLFILEALRSGLAAENTEQPLSAVPTIRSLLCQQVTRLSPAAAEMAGLAAVIGRLVHLDVLQQAAGAADAAMVQVLDELIRQRILREKGMPARRSETAAPDLTYEFTHDKLREAIYNHLSGARRRLLHHRVATALQARYPADPEAVHGTVAMHLERAGRPEEAASCWVRAGDNARRLSAREAAARAYERALPWLPAADQGPVLFRLGEALMWLGNWREAEDCLRQALDRRLPDEEETVLCQVTLANLLSRTARYDQSLQVLLAARDAVARRKDTRRLGLILSEMGTVHYTRGDLAGAMTCCMQLDTLARETADPGLAVRVLALQAYVALASGDHAGAQVGLRRAVDAAREMSNPWLIGALVGLEGYAGWLDDDWERAWNCFCAALDAARSAGDRMMAAGAIGLLGLAYQEWGDQERALRHMTHMAAVSAEVGGPIWLSFALSLMADVRLRGGDPQMAELLSARAVAVGRAVRMPYWLARVVQVATEVCLAQRRFGDARALNAEWMELASGLGHRGLQFDAAMKDLLLRRELGEIGPAAVQEQLSGCLRSDLPPPSRAAVHYELWRLGQHPHAPGGQTADHRTEAASLYRALHARMPRTLYRIRYAELTGGTLPDPPLLPELPDLPELEVEPGLEDLLAAADRLLQNLTAVPQPAAPGRV